MQRSVNSEVTWCISGISYIVCSFIWLLAPVKGLPCCTPLSGRQVLTIRAMRGRPLMMSDWQEGAAGGHGGGAMTYTRQPSLHQRWRRQQLHLWPYRRGPQLFSVRIRLLLAHLCERWSDRNVMNWDVRFVWGLRPDSPSLSRSLNFVIFIWIFFCVLQIFKNTIQLSLFSVSLSYLLYFSLSDLKGLVTNQNKTTYTDKVFLLYVSVSVTHV